MLISQLEYILHNTERVTKNGQPRENANIGYIRGEKNH